MLLHKAWGDRILFVYSTLPLVQQGSTVTYQCALLKHTIIKPLQEHGQIGCEWLTKKQKARSRMIDVSEVPHSIQVRGSW